MLVRFIYFLELVPKLESPSVPPSPHLITIPCTLLCLISQPEKKPLESSLNDRIEREREREQLCWPKIVWLVESVIKMLKKDFSTIKSLI